MKNIKLIEIVVFGFLLLINLDSNATHLRGGKISLDHFSGNTYDLSIEMYSDGTNMAGPNITAFIYEMDQNGSAPNYSNLVTQINLTGGMVANDMCSNSNFRIYSGQVIMLASIYQNSSGYWIEASAALRTESTNSIYYTGSPYFEIVFGYWFD